MSSVALVIPCYNEEKRLDVEALVAAKLKGRELELILVDDGSRDGTRGVLDAIATRRPRTVVLPLERNSGKAEAVRRGMLDALSRNPDSVGFWDADLATPLAELPGFVDVLDDRRDVDVVIGSRVKLMGRTIERNPVRHYLGRLFATAASVSLRLPVYDTQCGAKLFRATPLLARVLAEPFTARWVFDVELLARFMALDDRGPDHLEHSLVELPLQTWVDVSGSKLRSFDFVRSAVDLAVIRRKYGRQRPSRS